MKARKGFTLVELLLVVLIISVLASIVVPRISGAVEGAKVAKCDTNFVNLVKALDIYVATNGRWPVNNRAFQRDIVNSEKYFPHEPPKCPFGNNDYWYMAPGHPFLRGGDPFVKHTEKHPTNRHIERR